MNFFNQSKSNQSILMYVDDDTSQIKFFELIRIFNKKKSKQKDIEYLVEWKDYEHEHDVWRSFLKLDHAMNLIKKYKNVKQIILSNRFLLKKKSSKIKINRVNKYRKSFIVVVDSQQRFVVVFIDVVDFQQKSFVVVDQQQKFFAIIFALISFEQKFVVIIFSKSIFNHQKFFANFSVSVSKLLINNFHFNQFMTIVRRFSRFE